MKSPTSHFIIAILADTKITWHELLQNPLPAKIEPRKNIYTINICNAVILVDLSPWPGRGEEQAWEKCELILFGRVQPGEGARLSQGGVGWLLLPRFNQHN